MNEYKTYTGLMTVDLVGDNATKVHHPIFMMAFAQWLEYQPRQKAISAKAFNKLIREVQFVHTNAMWITFLNDVSNKTGVFLSFASTWTCLCDLTNKKIAEVVVADDELRRVTDI